MADDRSIKPRKQRGGWIEIEEPASVATEEKPAIIAGTSASEVPKTLSLSFDSLRDTFTQTIGASLWHQFSDGQIDLTVEQRKSVLGAVLDSVTVDGVRSLLNQLYTQNHGWTLSGSFPALVRIGRDYLRQHGVTFEPPPPDPRTQSLLDQLNRKKAGVQ